MGSEDVRDRALGSPAKPRAYFTEHLANERTHLAYVRTAVALFVFGITLNQFSYFIMESRAVSNPQSMIVGSRVGLGMVLLGMALALWSALRFDKVTADIDRGTYRPSRLVMWTLSLALLMLGASTTVWLLWR
jgi:putative membrane protein